MMIYHLIFNLLYFVSMDSNCHFVLVSCSAPHHVNKLSTFRDA